LRDEIGTGANGHIRMLKADWNDCPLEDADMDVMHEKGESVLNSAMAAWVLPVYAGLCRRLGDDAQADSAIALADRLRDAVRASWNGNWFHRAYAPGHAPIGEDYCWLEVQPWAILCGAATPAQAQSLLAYIRDHHMKASPVGARLIWPMRVNLPLFGSTDPAFGELGTLTNGAIWLAINMTLVWAAAKHDPELAWDLWRRLSLAGHTSAYPHIWEGTLSGPDSYNSPEHPRAGHTWAAPEFGLAMQSFPVSNMHSHSQPLLAYLRLLGIEPTPSGALQVGSGGSYASRTFSLNEDGSGHLIALGPVMVDSTRERVTGTGEISW
jgi:cellobiose phosphorylase